MLIVVRHGQSVANLEGKYAGHYNAQLTDTGRLQAEKSAEYVAANYKTDAVYSSDLDRAYYTAKALADKVGLEVVKMEEIKEIFCGKWENEKVSDVAVKYEEDYSAWVNDFSNCRPTGGESVKELYERIICAFKKLAEENVGKIAYVATHGTPIRALMAETSGAGLEKLSEVPWATNASLTFIDYKDGKLVAEKTSFDEHLAEMKTYLPKGV